MASLCVCLGLVSLSRAYDNVALYKPAHQLHQWNGNDSRSQASNGVDGRKSSFTLDGGQCVLSANNQRIAKWWVNLTSIHSIHHITIYYRTDGAEWGLTNGYTARFLGFSVYVSNTTDILQGTLCYKDDNFTRSTIPAVFTTTCPVHGQYVIYYNERLSGVKYSSGYSNFSFNEVCEVEVYGCSLTGYYGNNCSIPCPDVTCRYCHIETGTCQGCKPGYKGHRCELACSSGFFGEECALQCYNTCRGCNNVNGLCDRGCYPGWKGNYCRDYCTNFMYGENCSTSCGHCLARKQCHHINGTCTNGCESGYQGSSCTEACSGGMYGDKCNKSCGKCLGSEQCHHINGTCLNGCESGYQGPTCIQECSIWFYGENCKNKCGFCLNDSLTCDHITGACVGGCKPGYKAPNCDAACDDGRYGEKCREKCGECFGSNQCHHINGTCMDGCKSGYQEFNCKEHCNAGYYGKNCSSRCGYCLHNLTCHHITGSCVKGCKPGYQEPTCSDECDGRKYGENCSMQCGNCMGSAQCHHINGTCMNGCGSGFEGFNCTKECDDGYFGPNCIEKCNTTCRSCNRTTGICDNGCKPGWRGLYCQDECSAGYFGENCNSTCGLCLNETVCHHINGTCDKDCNPGYQVPYCTEECDDGTYGLRCNETCGHCSNGSSCSPVNGTCESGCDPGYRYFYCKEVCEVGTFGQNCTYKCNATCHGCNNVNGLCQTGCTHGWKGAYCHEALPQNNQNDEAPIIGGSIGVLAILIVICLIAFTIRRQRNQKSKQETFGCQLNGNMYSNTEMVVKSNSYSPYKNNSKDSAKPIQSTDNNKEELGENPIGENDIYMNEQFTPNIPVDQLESCIAVKRSKGSEGFKKEYAALPSGEIRCCEAGKKQENISKNRFKTTFPYDHSRVKLHVDDESSSDYINANYIDGANRPKEYIAAQGPKANTLADFWRMIWQENISTIVMLTNLKEGEKVKCTQYWPERNKPFSAGPVLVKLIEDKEYAFYVERKLSVCNKQFKKSRVVYQHHYTAWPDHGTPESLCLLTFHHHVISKATDNTNAPTVVHCSAGVGRTGTYIALDALYHTGTQTGRVNVVEFVKKMRESRVSMVQTFEQYITIYLALNNIFKATIKMDSSTDFYTKADKAIHDVQATQKEFQLLLDVRPTYTGIDYKVANQNSARNCTDTILPLDKYSLFLSSLVLNRGNYINAIFVSSLTNARRFIVTKYPTQDGAVDFLRLLNDHESDTVICMDPVHDIESIQSWLPDASSSTVVTPFTVHCQSKSKTDVTCHLIDILQEKNEDESHSVVVVEPRAKIGPFKNSQDTSHLRNLVSAALLSETENPITVVCSDGASLCGVFIAVHNAIQQLDKDGGVDVFTTVRQLQVRRPEFCANFNEYQMVYRTLHDHIQSTSESIYSNQ